MSKSHCKKKLAWAWESSYSHPWKCTASASQGCCSGSTHVPSSLLLTPKQTFLTSPGLRSVSSISQLEVDLVLLETTPNGCYLYPTATMTRSPAFSLLCTPHSTSQCCHLHSQLCCSWTIISPLNIKFIIFFLNYAASDLFMRL